MAKEKKRRTKRPGEEDKVLRMAVTVVIVLFVIAFIVVGMRLANPRVDTSEGEKKLKEINSADVKTVDAQIQQLEEEEEKADAERKKRPNKEKFEKSVVLGDWTAQGLKDYEVLEGAQVSAASEAQVKNPDDSGLTECIDKAVEKKPEKLFISVGSNDITGEAGDAAAFAEDYKKLIEKIKNALPDTVLYVNSILPVQSAAETGEALYAKVPEFNEQLKALCKEEGMIFLDSTSLVKEEYYAEDGIHVSSDFYKAWGDYMAEEAKL